MLIDAFIMIGNIREFQKGKMLVSLNIIKKTKDTFYSTLIVIGPAASLLINTVGMASDSFPGTLNLQS